MNHAYRFLFAVACAATMLLSGCATPSGASQAPAFAIEEEYRIGGPGGWDFIDFDSASQHLFIARGDHVQVWSASLKRVVGEIAGTEGVHGIALARNLGRGFTSNGKSNSVSVFDLATLKVIDRIAIQGANPDAILFEPVFKRVYVFNGRSHDATVIDASSLRVLATIPLGGKPEVAVSDAMGRVYVNIEDTAEIGVIDPVSYRLAARWPLAPCEEPTGLAIDAMHARLFAACANRRMAVVDARTGGLLAQVHIGAAPDGAAFDDGLGVAWTSNGEGTLTMVRPSDHIHYEAALTVPTRPRARTLALDRVTHRIYLVTARSGAAPAPTEQGPKPRPPMVPDSFEIVVVGSR